MPKLRHTRVETDMEILLRSKEAYRGIPMRVVFKVTDPAPLFQRPVESIVQAGSSHKRGKRRDMHKSFSLKIGSTHGYGPATTALNFMDKVLELSRFIETHMRLPEFR